MAQWTTPYVMRITDRIQDGYTNSYNEALKNSWATMVVSDVPAKGIKNIIDLFIENMKISYGGSGQMGYSDLDSLGYTVEVSRASGGFKLSKASFVADEFGRAAEAASQLGAEAALFMQMSTLQLILAGTTQAGLDKVPFFSSAHPVNYKNTNDGVYSNHQTSFPLNADNFAAAVAAIESRVMPNGTPRNLRAKYLLHSPQLKKAAREVTGAKFLATAAGGASDNVLLDYDVLPISVPGLATTEWMVTAEIPGSALGRPFGFARLIDFAITNYSGSDQAFLNRTSELDYQAEGYVQSFYGWPYLVHHCVG